MNWSCPSLYIYIYACVWGDICSVLKKLKTLFFYVGSAYRLPLSVVVFAFLKKVSMYKSTIGKTNKGGKFKLMAFFIMHVLFSSRRIYVYNEVFSLYLSLTLNSWLLMLLLCKHCYSCGWYDPEYLWNIQFENQLFVSNCSW